MFVTYVLYSKNYDRLYIGFTSDLIQRFKSHQHLATKGFTIKYRPWLVILVRFHANKKENRSRLHLSSYLAL
ncbi:MAG: GIY-YIG nuclease family protein [Bacteroidetes bacterium]|nr:GIY-YIG nuclease family protein [Bacteroidota bacterium]